MLSLGTEIRKARKEKGYSLRGLAKLANINYSYLSKIENDKAENSPSEQLVRWLAEFFDLDFDRLMYISGRIPEDRMTALKSFAKENPEEIAILLERIKNNELD